jgi:hypothetical protein
MARMRVTIPRIAGVAIMLAAVVTVQLPFPSASAQPAGGLCQHVGVVRPKPGLSSESKDFRFSFKGSVGPCQMSDGSTRWGVEFGAGQATGDCVARTASAIWTIVWNTGKRTVIEASFGGAGNLINTSGPVIKGEFVGATFEDGHFLSGFDPTACLSSSGVTKANYQGAFAIVPAA